MASEDFVYAPTDVSEALSRLCSVNSVNGSPVVLDAEDVLTKWQAVAPAAQTGVLDPQGLAKLRQLYSHVEDLVIACGAPDAFDVYEVCFEVLSKMGMCIPGDQNRQLLLQSLENVHEVYDVLLSCVETYEMVQPGSTRFVRLWMLQVLFAIFGSASISGRDLMELTDNDVAGAVSLIAYLIRSEQAPFEMQAAAGRCLVELTTADCVFLSAPDSADWQSEQIAKLTEMLNRHVNGLIRGIIQFDIVEVFGRCICQHQMSHARTDIIIKAFLTTIHNCLLYCNGSQGKLRQHLATQSTIVQDIMIPYVYNILPALYDNPSCGPSNIEWQNLMSTLQTFVVVTFNINVFRPQLRDSDLLCKVCEVPNVLCHISMMELIIKACINVDFLKGPYHETLLAYIYGGFSRLPVEEQHRLQRRMTSEQGLRLPFSRSAATSVQAFAFALTPPPAEEGQALEEKKARRQAEWNGQANKEQKMKTMFGMQATGAAGAEGDEMPPLMPGETWAPSLGQTDEMGVPSMAKCQLTGVLMHDPVQTPEGYLFERAALEDWLAGSLTNPLTGQPLAMSQCVPATNVANLIHGYQLQMLSAGALCPQAFDIVSEREVPAAPMPAPVSLPEPEAAPPASGSLLGDLPSLQKDGGGEKKKKEKGKIRITSRSVVDCPEDMRCAMDGKVMINPVVSPYGHRFERKTLERWMANVGSVCPITQQALRIDQCEPDAEMKKRIVRFLKGQ